jgi:two-component SAPR family response regulator
MGFTKGEIGLILWPDSSNSELKLRFKNAMYRMRHAIGSDVVLFQDNIYLFNRAVDYDYDVQNFLSAIKTAGEEKLDSKKIKVLARAVSIYKGHYLPALDAEWVVIDREKYLSMYTLAAEELAQLYFKQNEFEDALGTAQRALALSPYHEPLHRIVMQIYGARGDKASISYQYEKVQHLLMDEVGANPSEQTVQLYHQLIER